MMKNINVSNKISKTNPFLLFLFLDAALFVIILFKCIEQNLFMKEGVISKAYGNAFIITGIGIIILLHIIYSKFFKKTSLKILFIELGIFISIIYLPSRLATIHGKGHSYLWLPVEWHKLPDNLFLMIRTSPHWSFMMMACMLTLIWFSVTYRKRYYLIPLYMALAAVILTQILSTEGIIIGYIIEYLIPFLVAVFGMALGFHRLFTRTLLISGCTLILFWHYIGLLPFCPFEKKNMDPSIQILYPPPGERSLIPMAFLRQFVIDSQRNYLFTSYGPTSALVRFDITNKTIDTIPTKDGLVRYLWSEDDLEEVYVLEWIWAELVMLNKDPFYVKRRFDVYNDNMIVPMSFEVSDNKVYIVYTEYPSIAEFDRSTMEMQRQISFKNQGLTIFNSGAWRCVLDPRQNKIFVMIGSVDIQDTFALVRIDLNEFSIDGISHMPLSGPEIISIDEKRTILAPFFFSNKICEFDMDTLELKRTIKGPLNCRNIVYDTKRDLIYATSFIKGELFVIRHINGETLKKIRIGNKVMSMFFLKDKDELFLGSTWGILRVDLEKLLRKSLPQRDTE